MSDTSLPAAAAPAAEALSGRPDRAPLIAFVADALSEAVLREGLQDMAPQGLEMRRASIRQAIAALQKMPTPRTLIVDISGEEQPVSALVDLSDIVEPDVRVLVIGDREDTNFYRQLTRGLGVVEYLYKPLTRGMVTRHFGPWIGHGEPVADTVQGGRVVSITGVRGGAGATTVAANLAWHLGRDVRRHTLLLDPNLHTGDAALLLGARADSGLRTALETPDRVDELFIERTTHPAGDRLWVMAGEEKLSEQPAIANGAVQSLLNTVRRRYNFVVVDAPFQSTQMFRDFLDLSHQRILVLEPSLSGARDALRLMALPSGPAQARRPILLLNRAGQPGGLTTEQMQQAVGARMDVTIPFLPRLARTAGTLGEPAVAARGPFREAIQALAREAAFTRPVDADETGKPKRGGLRVLLGLPPRPAPAPPRSARPGFNPAPQIGSAP